jgi:hypothetical protein
MTDDWYVSVDTSSIYPNFYMSRTTLPIGSSVTRTPHVITYNDSLGGKSLTLSAFFELCKTKYIPGNPFQYVAFLNLVLAASLLTADNNIRNEKKDKDVASEQTVKPLLVLFSPRTVIDDVPTIRLY